MTTDLESLLDGLADHPERLVCHVDAVIAEVLFCHADIEMVHGDDGSPGRWRR